MTIHAPTTEPTPSDAPASAALMARARAVTPGGVNSPVRAFRAVGGTPRFMASGRGPWLTDVDGRDYVDLVCSWGPMILGHAHPDVLEAVREAGRARLLVRHALRERGAARRGDRRPGRPGRAAAPGLQRHRGDDERHPAGSRLHRPQPRREVRRALPRPRRQPPGQRRLRRRHPRPARQRRGARRRWRPRPSCCPTTTSRPSRPSSRPAAPTSPASSPRRPPATWASSRRTPGSPRRCAGSPPSTARCWSPTRS